MESEQHSDDEKDVKGKGTLTAGNGTSDDEEAAVNNQAGSVRNQQSDQDIWEFEEEINEEIDEGWAVQNTQYWGDDEGVTEAESQTSGIIRLWQSQTISKEKE